MKKEEIVPSRWSDIPQTVCWKPVSAAKNPRVSISKAVGGLPGLRHASLNPETWVIFPFFHTWESPKKGPTFNGSLQRWMERVLLDLSAADKCIGPLSELTVNDDPRRMPMSPNRSVRLLQSSVITGRFLIGFPLPMMMTLKFVRAATPRRNERIIPSSRLLPLPRAYGWSTK